MADIELIKLEELELLSDFLPGLLSLAQAAGEDAKRFTLGQFREWLLNNPQLINPAATNPALGDNSQKVATTAFVQGSLSGLGLNPATASQSGTVRTDVNDPVPTVYLKNTVDALLAQTIPISRGGTGATTAALARTALEAAKSGSNADITALTGLQTVPAIITQAINEVFRPGTMVLDAGTSTTRTGWLLCYGQAVSRTTYSALFSAIGTTYGAGDGSTTFNLPPMGGRSAVGEGTSPLGNSRPLGSRAGGEVVALSTANMPSHSHGGATQLCGTLDHLHQNSTSSDAGWHAHNTYITESATTAGGGSQQRYQAPGTGGRNLASDGAGTHSHVIFVASADRSLAHSHAINAEGSGQAFSTLDPYCVLRYWIKF